MGSRRVFTLMKPSCLDCVFFRNGGSGESIIQSTCKKFLVSPIQHTFADKTGLHNFHSRDKHPYALMARFDVSMCSLQGTFFQKKENVQRCKGE
jgi:hypothetical protein